MMKKLKTLIISIVLVCVLMTLSEAASVHAQETSGLVPFWTVTHGCPRGDEGWSVTVDAGHNVYLAGYDRTASATADVFIQKLSPDGTPLWNASWGGAYDDEAFIVTVKDGYVYAAGRTFSGLSLASADIFVLKFYADNGSLVWIRTWDGGSGYDEADGLVADGNSLYLSGWTARQSTQNDVALIKYDVNGTLVWARSWGTAGWDEANGQMCVDAEHVYVAGRYGAANMIVGGDAVLAAFNRVDGSYEWNVTWGGAGLDDAFGLASDGSYLYPVGITNSFGGDKIFLLKYDLSGTLAWSQLWGGNGSELARSAVAISGYVYVAGSTTSYGSGDFDVVLLKYATNGSLALAKTWGGTGLDRSHGVAIDGSLIYVAGDTWSYGAGDEDAFLLKVDVNGENVIPEFSPLFPLITLLILTLTLIISRKRKPHRVSNKIGNVVA